ncbi:MAG: DinB family protein [Pseudomonadota bacterium]
MITPIYCQTMARYNAWQNQWMYAAVNALDDAERRADRGLFWGSMLGTLCHLYWGDLIWMARFDGGPGPELGLKDSMEAYDWPMLMNGRPELDARITVWAGGLEQGDLEGDLSWMSGAAQRFMTMQKAVCITQLFNHQTHHRGQVHAALTAIGVKTTDTDLPFMPDEVPQWP